MPLVASMFFVAMLALLQAMYLPAQEAQATQAQSEVSATSLLSYREAVIDYLNVNPSFLGTVPDADLKFPWGYTRDPRWSHVVNVNSLYVYEVYPSKSSVFIDSLYLQTAKSYMVGRNVSGTLLSANGEATGIVVPSIIPVGSAFIAGK